MPASKAQQRATNKSIAKAYDRVNLTLLKGQKEVVQAHAEARSESVNAFIGRAILETMERDTGSPQEAAGVPESEVVSLPSEAIKTAQEAAQTAGEGLPQFLTRAIESRAALDKRGRR